MNITTLQRGVGLVEVLVAVLLLSIAVLGFSALQVRAVNATDESLVRTKSLTIVRNLAEVMRAYPEAYVTGSGTTFTTALPTATGAVPTVQAIAASTTLATTTSGTRACHQLAWIFQNKLYLDRI
ncbi:type IV pilus modification protein PilV [Psychrobacter piscatorii]|uniref:type IV pilus modification protein PilV n=1 Tax=Psychrobacter piscatorii TaxID=554343 RepID=UPI00338B2975